MGNLTTTTTAKLFLTDYASYNNGTQFEFGHWVELSDFNDADEFLQYITDHFKEADKTSPLDSPREEIMITDYENLPESLYSESGMNFEQVFEFLNLDDDDKIKVAFILYQGGKLNYALEKYDNVNLTEDTDNSKYELFDMYYPEIDDLTSKCYYLTIDYDHFIKENFTSFNYEGIDYLIEDSWNQ
jgi:hypothetical protein